MKLAFITVVLVAAVSAGPVSVVERSFPSLKDLQCKLITDIAALVNKAPNGAAFCSSYIASTVTSTKTSILTKTSNVTSTVPLTAYTTTTVTVPVPTSTTFVYSDCGVAGYDAPNTTVAYKADSTGAFANFAACSGLCKSDAACSSFAYGLTACYLYSAPVASHLNPVATSPYLFYDNACPASSVPTPAAAPAPTKRAILERSVPCPTAFAGLQASKISSACSCIIASPSTVTSIVPYTTTTTAINLIITSATVTTDISTATQTPATVTVTVTTSVA